MRNFLVTTCVGAVAVFAAGATYANDELMRMSQNPKDWVMPTGDYANTRYSQLKQITAQNVGKLQVAWTFSTGVLRGHEGGPLVIGNVMYVHGPFPNPVYALDLNNEAKILWKYEPKQDPNAPARRSLRSCSRAATGWSGTERALAKRVLGSCQHFITGTRQKINGKSQTLTGDQKI